MAIDGVGVRLVIGLQGVVNIKGVPLATCHVLVVHLSIVWLLWKAELFESLHRTFYNGHIMVSKGYENRRKLDMQFPAL